jgi:hypothetical protein
MITDPKGKPHQDDGDIDKRRRQEEALDDALKDTFPASDPISVEQPTTAGRARRSAAEPWPRLHDTERGESRGRPKPIESTGAACREFL